MKNIAFLSLLFFIPLIGLCDCGMSGIERAYKNSSYIFYGKFVGTVSTFNYYNCYGENLKIDNFEVIRFYKGPDSAACEAQRKKNGQGKYLVSLQNDCENRGRCFDNGKYYLVYCYGDGFYRTLSTSSCARTREIKNHNFLANEGSFDPNFGENEHELLKTLFSKDTLNNTYPLQKELEDELEELRRENNVLLGEKRRYVTYVYGLGGVILLLLGTVLVLMLKKRRS
jgi:hypothetical protein